MSASPHPMPEPVRPSATAQTPQLSQRRVAALALRLLARDWHAGELRVLVMALLVAVSSLTTVAFFADRVAHALEQEAGQLLGADLVIVSDHPLEAALRAEAERDGLRVVETVRFPSMTVGGENTVLTEIKAVAPGYPLRGRITVRASPAETAQRPDAIPLPGTVWVDERLLTRLGLRTGDHVGVGERSLRIAAEVIEDPDTGIGFFNLGPHLIMPLADVPSTGLVTFGSRVTYRLGVAGEAEAVHVFRTFAEAHVGPGQRVESVREARPEVRSALERAEKFLGLSALLAVLLAAVAVALAARRYLRRHLDAVAMMRCLGASQWLVVRLHLQQFLVLGLVAGAAGCLFGALGQAVLAWLLQPLVGVRLPAPGLLPVLQGLGAAFVLLFGFAVPPILALRRVPTLRVLRRDLGLPDTAGWTGYAAGAAGLAGLILWQAQDAKTGWIVLGGAVATMAGLALASVALLRVFTWVGRHSGFAWRFGLANLRRRPLSTVTQVVALGVGILALVLLTLVRADLLASWQRSLPPDVPNRFLVNVQPDQVAPLQALFAEEGIAPPVLYPMVRGRLSEINGRAVSSPDYADERAKRLIDREFNLSWAAQPQSDNRIVAGRWWSAADHGAQLFSVEEGIAQTLGIRMGDRLTYKIGGSRLEGKVSSLRKVEWDSFHVNFFVVSPPGMLDSYPATYVTSLHLRDDQSALLDRVVARFPNLLVVDVAKVLGHIKRIMDQVVRAVEFVFLFGLLAGLVVLFAAISATHDERSFDAAMLRTLGATGRQMLAASAAEFAATGALAGLLAAIGATLLGYVLADQVFDLPYTLDLRVWAAGLAGGTLGVLLAGLIGSRRVLRTPPMELFQTSA